MTVYSPRKGQVIQKAFNVMILYLPIVLWSLDLTPWHQCEALWKYWNQSRSLDLTGSHKNGVPKLVPLKWDRRKPVNVVKGLKCFTEKLGQSAHYAENNYKTTQHSDVTWAWRRVMGFYILVHYFGGKLLPAWKSNHMPSKMWDEIIYPFPNFNGCTVEVWGWMSNLVPHFTMDVITYPCWD